MCVVFGRKVEGELYTSFVKIKNESQRFRCYKGLI